MTRIQITPEFRGDLGELYFKHLCFQRGYAFIKLEDIHETLRTSKVLKFRFGFERIPIEIPDEIIDEVRRISTPIMLRDTNSFVFDFLTCHVYQEDRPDHPNMRVGGDFNWVEIKTGNSILSAHQEQVAGTCKIRFSIFRIVNVDDRPYYVDIDWEFASR
ncbi:MAG: hypothetical protein HMLIMOIP_000251 [Candidatus Nitrosomirales archaeon]|jgi:hypothetical protein